MKLLEKYKRFNKDNDFGIDHKFIEDYGRTVSHLMVAAFRPVIHDAERLPQKGGAIIYSNHSGAGLWDVLSIVHAINDHFRKTGHPERILRMVSHPNWFNWPVMDQFYAKMGYFPASIDNAVFLVEKGDLVWWLPEGNIGSWKTCDKKYQLQRFSTGMAVAASRTGCPVIPAAVIGGEEHHNIIWSSYRFAKQGFPLILANPIPYPFQLHIFVGEPLEIPESLRRTDLSKAELKQLTALARSRLQELIDASLPKRKFLFPRAARLIDETYKKLVIRSTSMNPDSP